MEKEIGISFELPKKIKGKYMGKHIKVLNLGDWTKTKVFIEEKRIKGILQGVDINLRIGELANVTLYFTDVPYKRMKLK